MKTIKITVLVLGLLSVASCSKTWTCEITTTTHQIVVGSDTLQGNETVKDYDFKGTKQEMKDFEQSGTKETNSYKQVTICK